MSAPASPLLERQAQLEVLVSRLQHAGQGNPIVVGIVAEAGAGKSRLADELRQACALQAVFLCGRAFQATATTPYSVWVDALEPYLRQLPRRELLHVMGTAADLPRLFPSCGHLGSEPITSIGGEGGAEQTRLFGQMAAMLERMTRDLSLVLVLDNLHWADTSSIELLHAVMRSVPQCKLLVLALFREDQVRADAPLNVCIDSLAQLGLAEKMHIPALSAEATGAILAHETGRTWPVGAVHQLHHLTQGNALFVHEFGRHTAARGAVGALMWDTIEELPATVQALLGERLWDLDDDCRRVLAFAAAFEAPIGYALLLALTGFSEDRLLDAMDRLCASRFLSESVSARAVVYEFHKPLVQATVYRGMGVARRQYLHRLIAAEVIRCKAHDAATIARHLIAGAGAGQHAEALPYLLRASQDAVAVFGNHEAISLLGSALQLVTVNANQNELQAKIYLDLGESNKRLGRFDDAIAAWTQALPLAGPRLAATLRRCIARSSWQAGREADALRVLQEGIARLTDAEHTEEAAFLRQEYALALARQGCLGEALDESRRALTLCDEERHPEVVARIYNVMGLAHGYRGDIRSASQAIDKSIGLCEDLPYPGAAFLTHYTMAGLLRYEGDFATFERHCETCMTIADRMHSVALASWPLSIRVERYALEGRISEAIEIGEKALALDRTTGQGAVLPRTHAFLGVAYRLAGDSAKARRHLNESRRLVSALQKREMRVVAVQACCEASVEFLEGNFERALALVLKLELAQDRSETPIAFYALHPHALPLAAEAAARLGRSDQAMELLAQIQQLRRSALQGGDGASMHIGALVKASRGQVRSACLDVERAIALWDAAGRPFHAARARLDLADWLHSEGEGEGDRAAELMNAAGASLTRMGAVREAAAVSQRLRKEGRRPQFGQQQRQIVGQPVSVREAEVVALVEQGKSNKAIAAELFLSELTIETHMKNILRKLGLKSRAQVAAYAASQRTAPVAPGAQLLAFPDRRIKLA